MDEAPRIAPAELKRRLDAGEDVAVLDVRRGSWDRSDIKIPRAQRIEVDELLDARAKLARETAIVTYCT